MPRKQAIPLPEQSVLRELFHYDPETGVLLWKPRSSAWFDRDYFATGWNGKHAGRPALSSLTPKGHLRGTLFGEQVMAHRVIWKWMTGEEPIDIDHINQNPSDNRWSNLRSVRVDVNMRNKRLYRSNKTGVNGVQVRRGRFIAGIKHKGRQINLGRFSTIEEAAAARASADAQYDYHPNHGAKRD